jgi:N,N-dimethylformamidase beta subunit-like, C-terminal
MLKLTTYSMGGAALTAALLALSIPAASASPLEEDEEHEGRAPTVIELTPAVEAAFPRESYAPGSSAELIVYNRAKGLRLEIFRSGPERIRTKGNVTMNGVPVTTPAAVGTSTGRKIIRVEIGDWPTGVFFARLRAADGRVGFAPFIVRPRRLGEHRVAVVMPTLTWQAYNRRDDDGDGKGDSWYARWSHKTVRLGRPFLNRGVPSNFRRYDLPFLQWLNRAHRGVDYLAQADLGAAPSATALAKAYDLIVFPGHHEYVTTREYDLVEGYRDLGGNLAFLSANNFFWRVIKGRGMMMKTLQWRDLDRPESALLGVQYRGNDDGSRRGPWILTDASANSWIFAGTGLGEGGGFKSWGIEIDQTAPSSPRGVQVLAEIPNLFGPGFTAQMTYYETPRGAKVFAFGAFTLAGAALDPEAGRVLENLWARLTRP